MLAVGVVILVIAFFGCYGAWKQSTCLLGIVGFYAVFILFSIYYIEITISRSSFR